MPKKTTKTIVPTPVEETSLPVEETIVNDASVEKKPKKSKKTKTVKQDIVEPEPVEETVVVKVEEEIQQSVPDVVMECAETGVCPVSKKAKRTITKIDVINDLESVFTDVLQEVKDKSLMKRVKQLKTDLVKLCKLRNPSKKGSENPNSGFLKPVDVSPEMRNFLNLEPSTLTRRRDITRRLCDYIKEKDLQDKKDRRNIIPDETLQKLFDVSDKDPPLTYYSIQQKLKPHIIKV